MSLWLAGAASAQILITEIQSVNNSGITDEDGTRHGWIEIWNPSPTAARTLVNYKLTDGTTTWTFPGATTTTAIRLAPDERMIVWASGKDRAEVTAPLHTNFQLSPAGGSIRLLDASNNVVSALENYPALEADTSWGRDESDKTPVPELTGVYSVPTPGEYNNYEGPGVAGGVVFDKPSQAFSGSITVSLSQATPEPAAEIRFTTDRTVPTPASPVYTGPIEVTATQMIRARIFQPGKLPGPTESHAYLSLSPEAAEFTSSMSVIVLSNFRTTTIPDNGDQDCFVWVWQPAPPDNLVRLTNLPDFASRAVSDKRGSSTLGNPKFNLNVEFRNPYDEEELDYGLLGMAPHSDWILHGPFEFDRSLLHNPFMFALSRSIGRWATDFRMAEVFIDVNGGTLRFTGAGSGDYFGIYNVIEKIRRSGERLNLTRLDPYDNDDRRKTGGYIWKVDRRDPGDTGFSAGGQSELAYYYPKEVQIKSAQRDPQEKYLTSYINSFYASLTSRTYDQWIDVPAAIDHHLMNVWSFNVDAFRLSGFWHKDREGLMVAGPVWDFDRALSSTDGRDSNPTVWRSTSGDLGTDFFNYTWWNRLFRDIDFYQRYIDRWQELRRREFSPEVVNALIDSLNAQFSEEAIQRDLARWRKTKRAWTGPYALNRVPTGSQAAEVQRLKDYLQVRANFMDSQWVAPVTVEPAGGFITPGTTVTLSGPEGLPIYYTLDGSDPRPSGGGPPEAGVAQYSGPITISQTTRLKARIYDANHTALTGSGRPPLVSKWGGLSHIYYSTDPPAAGGTLVLSEIHYHPADPTPAEQAINSGWSDNSFEFLELWNRSAGPIDLSGVRVTGAVEFAFAPDAGLILPAGGCVVLSANPAAFAARYPEVPAVYGPWRGSLANSSEEIRILAADGTTLIMSVTYDDGWEPSTDGGGASLVVYDLDAEVAAFDSAANWRPSAQPNGSPGAHDAASLPLNGTPQGHLAQWQAQYPGIGGLNSDFDGDGYSNILEYAFGTDPTKPGGEGAPEYAVENGKLTITFTRLKAPANVTYVPETSNGTGEFSPEPASFTETVLSENSTTQRVKLTDTASLTPPVKRYVRLRITAQ